MGTMKEVYVCGFNGFGQFDVLGHMLTSFCETKQQEKLVLNASSVCAGGQNDSSSRNKSEGSGMSSMISDNNRPSKKTHDVLNSCTNSEMQKNKTKQEQCPSNVNRNVCGEDTAANHSQICTLKCICQYSVNSLQIKNVAVTWPRIAVTWSSLHMSGDDQNTCTDQTFISGSSSQADDAEPLQLHLPNTKFLGSNWSDMMLQYDGHLLVLQENADQPVSASFKCYFQDEQGMFEQAVKLEAVSGMSSVFIVCYDGISIGQLKVDTDQKNLTGPCGDSAGVILQLSPLDSGLSVRHISCGLEHSLLLTQHGGVLSFGSGSRGQLGNGVLESEQCPQMVAALEGLCFVTVAAGGWHSAALSDSGDLYMWGWNESGQLGLPSPAVQGDVSCQGQQEHQDTQTAASLHLWPVCVDVGPQAEHVVAVACGSRHSAVVTSSGKAYTTGWNKYCQLGVLDRRSVDSFMLVVFPRQVTVEQVWCGSWSSIFAVKNIHSEEKT